MTKNKIKKKITLLCRKFISMENKCSGSCVSELVEYWSLAIVHSSIQWGGEWVGMEVLISKIYKDFS